MQFGSLFSGIGGFDIALERAGMSCAFQIEQNTDANKVLARHWPTVPRFTDVKEFNASSTTLRPGIICGGWPCQGNSVAGKRAGMADERSGLWGEVVRILAEFRPEWFLGENVPGILSVNGGRDWLTVLRDLAGLGYGFAYRVLDSQWFGLAQRRKRVFIVAHLGDWRRAAQILFESDCLPWNPAPSRETGARVAASLTRGSAASRGVNAPGRRRDDDTNIVVNCLDAHMGMGGADDNAAQANHPVAHTLRAEGHDASEDGSGRGVPLVVTPILEAGARTGKSTNDPRAGIGIGDEGDPMFTLQSGKQHAIAYSASDYSNGQFTETDTARTLTTSDDRSRAAPVVAYRDERGRTSGDRASEEVTFPLHAAKGQSEQQIVAFQTRIARNGRGQPKEITDALTSCEGGTHADSKPHVAGSFGVRRLLPVECERLQGFPDGWTEGLSDSGRYRTLGNAVSVPVVEWIARRIASQV